MLSYTQSFTIAFYFVFTANSLKVQSNQPRCPAIRTEAVSRAVAVETVVVATSTVTVKDIDALPALTPLKIEEEDQVPTVPTPMDVSSPFPILLQN